ncbi:MAG: hypothetical protein EOP76_09545 [Variovorax sp.]|nr:MAG: hypothetical protein EOP76_09545 [Variovorax sp.]
MNPEFVYTACLALGLIGTAFGAWLLARPLRAQLVAQQQALQAALQASLGAQTEAQVQLQTQFQTLQKEWQEAIAALSIAPAVAPSAPALPMAVSSPPADVGHLLEPLQVQTAALFEAHRQSLEQFLGEMLRRTTEQALQKADQTLQQSLQRVPQLVQRAIQVELEFQAQQQADRDRVRTHDQQAWQAGHDARRADDLRTLLHALTTLPEPAASSQPSQRISVPAPGATPPSPPPPPSARPPELMHTPLPRPEPVQVPDVMERELTDEELDALPPELPAETRPRKRILPAPKKPTLNRL